MRGGARPGSGRKKGGKNARTRAIADKAAAEGITPLEVMIQAMRDRWADKDVTGALEAAHMAAPYMHPRLAAVENTGQGGGPLQIIIGTGVPREPADG